jgi:hypothetical protein
MQRRIEQRGYNSSTPTMMRPTVMKAPYYVYNAREEDSVIFKSYKKEHLIMKIRNTSIHNTSLNLKTNYEKIKNCLVYVKSNIEQFRKSVQW